MARIIKEVPAGSGQIEDRLPRRRPGHRRFVCRHPRTGHLQPLQVVELPVNPTSAKSTGESSRAKAMEAMERRSDKGKMRSTQS